MTDFVLSPTIIQDLFIAIAWLLGGMLITSVVASVAVMVLFVWSSVMGASDD